MSRERFELVRSLFDEAVDRPTVLRAAFLDERCAGDRALREEVERLLGHDATTRSLAGEQAVGDAIRAFVDSVPSGLERIGPYRLVRPLGQGGMGAVYEAWQESPRRRVAVKLLRADSVSAEALRRFRHEADVLARLRHPGIASVYDAGVAETPFGPRPYIAMELVEGEPLPRHLAKAALSIRSRVELVAFVCDAVEHAHTQGVVHRDLKPSNILVDASGAPRLVDFGIARVVQRDLDATRESTMHTRAGQLIGTLAYMSPEQVGGADDRIAASADVYAIGVVLFEALTGRLPVDVRGLPFAEALRKLREQDPSRLSATDTTLRGDLETVVLKALERDPARRYQTAGELGADLRRFLRDEPILARRASGAYRAKKFVARHRLLVGASATVFVLLVTALVVVGQLAIRERQQRRLAEANEARARVESYRNAIAVARQSLALGDALTAIRALDGAPEELRRWEWSYLRASVDTSRARWEGGGAAVLAVAVTRPDRDRSSILSVDAAGTVMLRREGESEPAWRAVASTEGVASAAVDPAGTACLTCDRRGRATMWLVGHAAPAWEAEGVARVHRQAFASRDGAVALVRDGAIELRAVDDGEVLRRIPLITQDAADASIDVVGGLAVVRAGRFAFTLDASTGAELWRRECDEYVLDRGEPGGIWLYSDWSRSAQRFDLRTGERTAAIESAPGLTTHAGSARMLTLDESGAVRVRSLPGGETTATLVGQTERASALAFDPSGERVVAGSSDGAIRMWAARPTGSAFVIEGSNDGTIAAWFSADGSSARTAGWGSVKAWRLADGAEEGTSFPLDRPIRGLAPVVTSPGAAPSGLVAVGDDGRVAELSLEDAEVVRLSPSSGVSLRCVACARGDGTIVAGADDGRLLTYSATLELIDERSASDAPIDAIALSPDEQAIAVADRAGRVWLREGGAASRTTLVGADLLRGDGESRAVALAFDPAARTLSSAHTDGSVRLWDRATRTERIALRRPSAAEARAVAFSPDGERLAIGYSDPLLRVVDVANGETMLDLATGEVGPMHVAFTEGGRTLAAAIAAPVGGLMIFSSHRAVDSADRAFMQGVRQAVRERFGREHFAEDVVRSLSEDAMLSEPFRAAAIAQATARGDHPNVLNGQAWAVVRQPVSSNADVALALREARRACDLRPDWHPFLNTLGLAEWRAGLFDVADRTLSRAIELHRAERGDGHPLNFAARAAARHGAGRTTEAAEDLAEARKLMLKPGYRQDEETRLLLAEIEAIIAAGT